MYPLQHKGSSRERGYNGVAIYTCLPSAYPGLNYIKTGRGDRRIDEYVVEG